MTITAELPTKWGNFTIHAINKTPNEKEHVALTMGDLHSPEPILVRIHSECLTGDAFSSLRCDCGPQLDAAMQKVAKEGRGIIIYLRQEGRGIGLINKIKAYALQDAGMDTVEANLKLGFQADQRNFSIAAEFLKQLKISKVKLMTNNPRKIKALTDSKIDIVERVKIQFGETAYNKQYLATKHGKLGHFLE